MTFRLPFLLLFTLCICITAQAKKPKLISGPMQGHFTETKAGFWIMVRHTDEVTVTLEGGGVTQTVSLSTDTFFTDRKHYTPLTFWFTGLDNENDYTITSIQTDDRTHELNFPVKLADYTPGADYSFHVQSCNFTPPGGLKWMHPGIEDRVYQYVTGKESDFSLWLGDYSYYLRFHYRSKQGMFRRYRWKRNKKKQMAFMTSRPQYSIWDDHDYGPNNSDGTFELKDFAVKIHKMFWVNPGYGTEDNPGCYFNFRYNDSEFFMLDDRYNRTEPDSDNPQVLGGAQVQWLKNKLLASDATFKFIALGSQWINVANDKECYTMYPEEQQEVLGFIKEHDIKGVILLSGDRHHSEMLKVERDGTYPLYEFTSSGITSFHSRIAKKEEGLNNPSRIDGTLYPRQNFGRISVSGSVGSRKVLMEIFDKRGELVWDFTLTEEQLR